MSTLAERIKEALEKSGETPAGLARACKISAASVSNWMSGSTQSLKLETGLPAAEFLKVNPWWLADGRNPMQATDEIRSSKEQEFSPAVSELLKAVTANPPLQDADVRLLVQIAVRLRSVRIPDKTRKLIASRGDDPGALEGLLTTAQVKKKTKEGA